VRRLALLLAALALLAAACGGSGGEAQEGGWSAVPELADLGSVESFAERFNADAGVPRLVVLVAPT
jgi:hypothetical protein